MIAAATPAFHGPHIDWAGISPLIALLGGVVVVLLVGLLRPRAIRTVGVPVLALVSLGAAIGLTIWQWNSSGELIAGALKIDDLGLGISMIIFVSAIATVLLSWRASAPVQASHGEYYAMLLTSVAGMVVLAWAINTVSVFVGFELLSIPLYVLCASEMRRASSLESGLKYLIVGSVGSATLVYGLAMLYGATGTTDFSAIATAATNSVGGDVLFLTGIAFVIAGLAFKASIAPFHAWTPDVYEGAPTPITAFMATATKAAAFAVFLRIADTALLQDQLDWGPLLAVLAAISIIVGNLGALAQNSVKRMLAWSSVAQAGYILSGVAVATRLGINATAFYLAVYLVMNMAAFAVVVARERETPLGDDISALAGIGATRPWLAWPMTLAMLGLAGIPATAGFVGKLFLIEASIDGDFTWLGVFIVVGSMISLGYYLRVVAVMWMRREPAEARIAVSGVPGQPALAGGADDDAGNPSSGALGGHRIQLEVAFVAVLFGALTLILGIVPAPLFHLIDNAGAAFTNLV
jgi:NADH-quinone oxidoreductase subunit N